MRLLARLGRGLLGRPAGCADWAKQTTRARAGWRGSLGHSLVRREGAQLGSCAGWAEGRGERAKWSSGELGLLAPVQEKENEGEKRECWAGQGTRGEKREGNRFSNLCLNGLNLDLRRIHHILGRISKVKYKAVFEESFGGIHINSR